MPRFILEFDSAEEMLAFTQRNAAGQGPNVSTPVVIANTHPQTISLTGSVGEHEGSEAMVISIGGRGDDGPGVVHLAPGDRRLVAR